MTMVKERYSTESLEKYCMIHGGHLPCKVCGFSHDMSAQEKEEHIKLLTQEQELREGGRL